MGKILVTQEVAEHIEKHKDNDLGLWIYDAIGRTDNEFYKDNNITYTELVSAIENGYVVFEVGDLVYNARHDEIYQISDNGERLESQYPNTELKSMKRTGIENYKLVAKAKDVIK